jgi:hypothetical protein
MRKEYDLKTQKVKRRGMLPDLPEPDDRHLKVRITIALAKDIVDYFKAEAEKPGALPDPDQSGSSLSDAVRNRKYQRLSSKGP